MAEVHDSQLSWLHSNSLESLNTFYRRKYPIRLPKLPDSPKKWLEFDVNTDFDETMSVLNKQHLFRKSGSPENLRQKSVIQQIESLKLEDVGDIDVEADLNEFQSLQPKPKSRTKKYKEKKLLLQQRRLSESQQDSVQQHFRNSRSYSLPVNTPPKKKKDCRVIVSVSPVKSLNRRHNGVLVMQNNPKVTDSKPRPKLSVRREDSGLKSKKGEFPVNVILKVKEKTTVIQNITEKMKTQISIKNSSTTQGNRTKVNLENPSTRLTTRDTFRVAHKTTRSKKIFQDGARSNKIQMKEEERVSDEIKIETPSQKEHVNVIPEKIEKPDETELFWKDAVNDAQMKFLQDKTTEILVQRNEFDKLKGEPISFCVAKALRLILFGSSLTSFNGAWKDQILVFNKSGHYGLKFFKDGPVDIMVPLQAFVMKYLLFINIPPSNVDITERLQPDVDIQQRALHLSLCDMLWRAGGKEHAIVALPLGEGRFVPDSSYREDKITEKYELFKFTIYENLEKFLRRNVRQFQENGSYGLISLLYSLMLSRGLISLLKDCDELSYGLLESSEGNNSIISKSQALINLCIHGKAVPNIFNGDMEIKNDESGEIKTLKGVQKRCEVGYLSHCEFVYPKTHMVGSCLKTPLFPIWVVNNCGRICVLFSLKRYLLNDWKLERRFDVYLYQGISRYVASVQLDIRLSIDTIRPILENEYEDDDNSTLEETIRTKWGDAVIEWNGHTRF